MGLNLVHLWAVENHQPGAHIDSLYIESGQFANVQTMIQQEAQQQAERLNARIIDLERQLAHAELKLELYESGELKPKA